MEQITKRFMNWASILDDQTREQAQMTSEMPFIHPHLALMPDAHLGKGATVGSVIPTLGAIIPAAVGVDIGCGMMAVQTGINVNQVPWTTEDLHGAISAAVPLSAGKYNTEITENAGYLLEELEDMQGSATAERLAPNWRYQLGTLGSGNHFIEVSLDESNEIWLFLHSGSRGVGNKIAQHHIKIAQKQCEKRYISLPHKDLAYLVEGDDEFWAYMRDLRWAQRFAHLNRVEMMNRVIECFNTWSGDVAWKTDTQIINCHHNYTSKEYHFGKDVWVSRKGAIDATEGVRGLIPGSMGTRSYVVTGKGSALALNSAPHGAGRNHSRTAAKKLFTRADLDARMKGVAWGESDAFLDEHPDAYKSIDVVMQDAQDLVSIDHTLRQIVNVKGD